jgi:hypothetical protein
MTNMTGGGNWTNNQTWPPANCTDGNCTPPFNCTDGNCTFMPNMTDMIFRALQNLSQGNFTDFRPEFLLHIAEKLNLTHFFMDMMNQTQ